MILDYNTKRADLVSHFKSKHQSGPMVPLVVTKTQNDPNENVCQLDFFANSSYERWNRTFSKSYMLFQRYVPCKGANANIIRCVWTKDSMQKRVFRIQTTTKMSGHLEAEEEAGGSDNEDSDFNEEELEEESNDESSEESYEETDEESEASDGESEIEEEKPKPQRRPKAPAKPKEPKKLKVA